jgi:hypothetical protein
VRCNLPRSKFFAVRGTWYAIVRCGVVENPSSAVDNETARLRDRAEEAQLLGEAMHYPNTRLEMFKLAETYRRLAEHAVRWRRKSCEQ